MGGRVPRPVRRPLRTLADSIAWRGWAADRRRQRDLLRCRQLCGRFHRLGSFAASDREAACPRRRALAVVVAEATLLRTCCTRALGPGGINIERSLRPATGRKFAGSKERSSFEFGFSGGRSHPQPCKRNQSSVMHVHVTSSSSCFPSLKRVTFGFISSISAESPLRTTISVRELYNCRYFTIVQQRDELGVSKTHRAIESTSSPKLSSRCFLTPTTHSSRAECQACSLSPERSGFPGSAQLRSSTERRPASMHHLRLRSRKAPIGG